MRSTRRRRVVACVVLLAVGFVGLRPAGAQEAGDAARAEAMFREGKGLLERRDYEHACPLLASSFALDPGTGTLLALAICHEAQGKLASASADYDEVAARATREGRADRERVARERGRALRGQASTLVIVTLAAAPLPEGFVVRRDGTPLDASSLGVPVPVDGGEHVIEAVAAHKRPWLARIQLAPTGDRRIVAIPELADASAAAVAAAPPASSAAAPPSVPSVVRESAPPTSEPTGTSPLRVAGVVLMGTGAVALGVSAFFGVRAKLHNDDSKNGCMGDDCNPQGTADRLAAVSAGNNATSAFVAGLVSAAIGGTLYYVGRHRGAPRSGSALTGRVEVDRGGARFLLEAAFSP